MGIFRNTPLPDDALVMRAAAEALTHPPDSAFSDRDLFVTWGLTIGMSRDSDLLETSNYARVFEDMRRVFPADVYQVHAGHWAVGWVDQLAVRVLEPWADPDDYTARDVTRAFKVITSISTSLRDDYPLYDESDYSDREYKKWLEQEEENWSDVKYKLWQDYDVEDVTEADREVHAELWREDEEYHGMSETWLDPAKAAAEIMAARREAAAAAERAAFETANTPLPGMEEL